jgi:succinate dehydrogenase / fumarate reductase, cytochrome b subunit
MSLKRNVGAVQGLAYRGGSPMIAWVLHRISGLGILIFVGFHVIASFFMQQTGSDLATSINIIYESWAFQIVIAFFVLFHALNGLRIVIQDFYPKAQMYQHELLWLQWIIFIPVYGLTVFFLIQRGLGSG